MAKNKKQDLTKLSEDQIHNEIMETETRLKKMKFSHSITPIENPMTIRDARRSVARLKTELTRRELN